SISLDWLINKTVSFFEHESCGKCTPCREGAYWMKQLTSRIHNGEGTQDDVELLKSVATQIRGTTLCALGEFSTMAVVSSIERFPEDFEAKV
ncbi:MAG: NADH-quinone oxidoreductase subunit F, partial [Anaerolineales bacterium]|nr:NADH-quinone oxidoreductase subunit F [Anaerolineales bacterium]